MSSLTNVLPCTFVNYEFARQTRFCWKPLTSCQSSEFAVSKLTHWLVHGRTSQCSGTGGGGYPLSGAIHPCTAPDNEFDETSNSLLSRTTSIHPWTFCRKRTAGRLCSEAEKPASDDAGTEKRLEPETSFCASKIMVTSKKSNSQSALADMINQ